MGIYFLKWNNSRQIGKVAHSLKKRKNLAPSYRIVAISCQNISSAKGFSYNGAQKKFIKMFSKTTLKKLSFVKIECHINDYLQLSEKVGKLLFPFGAKYLSDAIFSYILQPTLHISTD